MIGSLLELVVSWFAGDRAHDATVRSMRRDRANAYTDGKDVFFPGMVLGDVPYASPEGGSWLVLSGSDLAWSGAEGYGRALWTSIPVTHLQVRNERAPRRDIESRVPRNWRVFDCHDGTTSVLLACERDDARYLRIGLGLPTTADS